MPGQSAGAHQGVAEGSLKRLKVDTINLFYEPRVESDLSIEDVAGR